MDVETIIKRLDRLSNNESQDFDYSIGAKLTLLDFAQTELKLNVSFPENIKKFYNEINGLKTNNPSFEIIDLMNLEINEQLIPFAIFDNDHLVCFKIDTFNSANEWSIVELKTKYELTKTISSFWSNKIWHWLEKQHKIWSDNWWENN